jgi:hypothetical protein
MYRGEDSKQIYLEDFNLQFGGKLRADNRWVKLSKIMPWEKIEEIYARNFSLDSGATAIAARIAFGAIYAKEQEEWTDRETVQNFMENPYFQYFLGFKEFQNHPPFDSSMMVYFRKRFSNEAINEINETIFLSAAREAELNKNDTAPTKSKDDEPPDQGGSGVDGNNDESAMPANTENEIGHEATPSANKGKLIVDATCAPADIRYPTDLSLLNEARENTERIIDILRPPSHAQIREDKRKRKKARNAYLAIIKQKRPGTRKIRNAIKKQLKYLSKNIETIDVLLHKNGFDSLEEKYLNRFMVICDVYYQQLTMYNNNTRRIEGRIVSLRQPHIRPIVRGKAGKKYEFGQKIAISVVGGYTFIAKQEFENFNEATLLMENIEWYKERFGFYPEAVLADQIYRNQKNINFCVQHGIRISGAKLGKPELPAAESLNEIEYQDYCERNIVEGRIGISKRRFGLDLIMCYLPETALTEAALQVLCTNLSLWLRFILSFFRKAMFHFWFFDFSFAH